MPFVRIGAADLVLQPADVLSHVIARRACLSAAQAYAAGQRNAVDPGALAAHMGLPTSQVPPSWSALAALQSLDSPADAALRQVRGGDRRTYTRPCCIDPAA